MNSYIEIFKVLNLPSTNMHHGYEVEEQAYKSRKCQSKIKTRFKDSYAFCYKAFIYYFESLIFHHLHTFGHLQLFLVGDE
jgi:hypothetical protein